MEFTNDTEAIIASNLTVAYSILHESNYGVNKPDREKLLRDHVISTLKSFIRDLHSASLSPAPLKSKA